ncbi:PREDICTED: two pore potassium channel c-like [Prunus mume]|uniref:Two pore potassium channel c-like n=1 Tax=Prunus mume TaxID=102107 RepID=A0ABM1LNI9_PRUMU|nr:PREDICTED: two pore potassium channel c-like [Prunus mume]
MTQDLALAAKMNQSLAEAQHQQLPCPPSLSPAPLVTGDDAIGPDPIPTPPTCSSCSNPIAILNNNNKKLIIGLIVYVIIGIVIFCTTSFELEKTNKLVDALYYIVVTLCTIGYGDIVPSTTLAKYLTCFFILLGFGFFDLLLNGLVAYICDKESVLLRPSDGKFKNMIQTYMVDKKKGRIRTRSKIGLALGIVIVCIGIGTVAVHFLEGMSWPDCICLSVTSVTTLGYGDSSFKTTAGRCFAIVWLLVSTLAVARAFLYFTELRMEKRNRRIPEWVLQKEVTLRDLKAADLDNDGCDSKSDFIIYKLKEMGRVAESDILQICKKFDTLEHSNKFSELHSLFYYLCFGVSDKIHSIPK